MSDLSGEQALGTIAGGVAGFFLGGPLGAAKGAYFGYGIGSAFTTTELDAAEGPRLEDRSIQTSRYGDYIPRVYNTDQLSGNVFWLLGNKISELKKTETVEQGGKGGGTEQKVTTFSYSVTCAISICEGPITGIRRIWADNELVFDASGSSDAAMAQSYEVFQQNEIFLGNSDQLPSTTIEEEKGEGNVPAYRGRAYIVLRDFQLEEYGNRIPNFKFEVVDNELNGYDPTNASLMSVNTLQQDPSPWPSFGGTTSMWKTHPWYYKDGVLFGMCAKNDDTNSQSKVPGYKMSYPVDDMSTPVSGELFDMKGWLRSSLFKVNGDFWIRPKPIDNSNDLFLIHYRNSSNKPGLAIGKLGGGSAHLQELEPDIFTSMQFPNLYLRASYRNGYVYLSDQYGRLFKDYLGELFVVNVSILVSGRNELSTLHVSGSTPERSGGTSDKVAWGIDPYGTAVYTIDRNSDTLVSYSELLKPIQSYDISNLTALPYSKTEGNWSDRFVVRGNLIYVTHHKANVHGAKNFIRILEVGDTTVTQLDEVEISTIYTDGTSTVGVIDINYSMAAITEVYNQLDDGDTSLLSLTPLLPNSTGLTLPQVIGEEMSRIDALDSDDFDVTGVTADTVRGYMISNPSPATSALKPLQQAFRFDVVEEDYKIKFVTRGTVSSSVTLTPSDLRAHEQGSEAPPELLQLIKNPNAVPGRIEISYKDVGIDLETGYAYADRLNLDREAITKMDLPVVLSNDDAAQTAEVLILDSEREGSGHYQMVTSFIHSHLERADVITVTTDNEDALLLRIVDIEKGAPGIVKITAVRETVTDYNSVAVGDDSNYDPDTLGSRLPAFLRFLDLPQLRAGDDDPGMYWSVNAIGDPEGWPGASVFRSLDEGISWGLMNSSLNSVVQGIATSSLTDDTYAIFTYEQTLSVYLPYGSVETKTETQVRNGANAVAYGAPGRWEVIKFIQATSLGSGEYEVTGLLRGQFGTDHNMNNHEEGDFFVMLDDTGLRRQVMTETAYLNDVNYAAMTIGADFNTGGSFTEASTGEAKKPHSPTHVKGYRDAAGDLTIEWIPRGRYNFEWSNGQAQTVTDTDVFNVEIMDGATVVRTITSTVAIHNVSYTAAEQVTDFGTAQSSLTVNIHQVGDLITTGHKREATI